MNVTVQIVALQELPISTELMAEIMITTHLMGLDLFTCTQSQNKSVCETTIYIRKGNDITPIRPI